MRSTRLLTLLALFASPTMPLAQPQSSQFWTSDLAERFLELRGDNETDSYDLSTVQIVVPGRFTVVRVTIDTPEVMKLKLKALDSLRSHCARPDGLYPAPADLFALGPPDMPVENIEVKSGQTNLSGKKYPTKSAFWSLPYKRLALNTRGSLERYPSVFHCSDVSKTGSQLYLEERASITNGIRVRMLYDCRRGLVGQLFRESADPTKAVTGSVRGGFLREYVAVCYRVTGEDPYLPQ